MFEVVDCVSLLDGGLNGVPSVDVGLLHRSVFSLGLPPVGALPLDVQTTGVYLACVVFGVAPLRQLLALLHYYLVRRNQFVTLKELRPHLHYQFLLLLRKFAEFQRANHSRSLALVFNQPHMVSVRNAVGGHVESVSRILELQFQRAVALRRELL